MQNESTPDDDTVPFLTYAKQLKGIFYLNRVK